MAFVRYDDAAEFALDLDECVIGLMGGLNDDGLLWTVNEGSGYLTLPLPLEKPSGDCILLTTTSALDLETLRSARLMKRTLCLLEG